MIDFNPIKIKDKELYDKYLFDGKTRGCEYTFANLNMWGHSKIGLLYNHLVIFYNYNGHLVYPFPLGTGDKKTVLDAIIADSKERGIPCTISGVTSAEQLILEKLYPGKFHFHYNRDSFDYVYAIDDLADLKGRKYHRKRNHLHRFYEAFPNYTVEPLSKDNLPHVRKMLEQWYALRLQDQPDSDFKTEQIALEKAFTHYSELSLDGLVLFNREQVLAFTIGSRMSLDTFDVHFEKARSDANGAYPAINCEFAKYIREKYPEVRFLDREEDMGLEGLRKAKESYNPHHLFEKCWATLIEE